MFPRAVYYLKIKAGRSVFSSCEAHLIDERARKNAEIPAFNSNSGAPGGNKLEPLGAATIIAHFLYENNEPGLFMPQHFTQKELAQLKAQENYKV